MLLLLAACAAPAAGAVPVPDAHTAAPEVTGWYRNESGDTVLVTWGASGGYRVVNFARNTLGILDEPVAGRSAFRAARAAAPAEARVFGGARADSIHVSRAPDEFVLRRIAGGPFTQRALRFGGPDAPLAGVLLTPRGGARSGAVIVHGSGTSDRDSGWYWSLAAQLARTGVAVLFPDKRGSGASRGDWRTASFRDLADDALAGVDALRTSGAVRGGVIGLVGVSQGGWVAPLAAERSPHVAWVVNLSGAAVTPGEQVTHELRQDLRAAGLPQPLADQVVALQDTAAHYIRGRLPWSVYRAALERGLASPWTQVAARFPAREDAWEWGWWRNVVDFDPVPLWASLRVPSLIVYGDQDEQDNVPVRRSVERLRHAAGSRRGAPLDVRVFEGTGHALQEAGSRELRADFRATLSEWIRARTPPAPR